MEQTLQSFIIERDCSDRESWDAYVQANPSSSTYHRYGWRDVIEKSFNHRCFYLAARDHTGVIAGVLPLVFMQSRLFGRFLISLPFFNFGGVICDRQEIGDVLLAEAANLQKELGAEYTELRHIEKWPGGLPTKQRKVAMILDLAKDAETQWKCFNAKLRNQVRKAEKSGLEASIGGKEFVADFYTVFVRNMRDLGTPVYAKKFFTEVLRAFPDHSRIIAVHLDKKPVAAGLITWFHDTVEIPWASSIRDFNALCPNNLLYWTALQFALEKGFERFDFGRSTPGEGTYKFKAQWGAKPIQLHWQYLLPVGVSMPELNTKNPKYEMAIKMWQRLPLPVTRILGPVIVKNIP
jgi:serine/alanine adding enzyme